MQRLAGKVALVTGGARGIGLATARRFAEEGAAAVILADIDARTGARAAAEHPAFAFCALDVTDDAAWQQAVDDVVARHGHLDIVVNSAGIAVVATIESVTLEQWRRVQAVNVDGTFLGCRHAVRAMKPPTGRGGALINLSSVSGIVGGHNLAAYNASKGGVRLLTKSVALHCARQGYGIRCNSIHPGFTETDMLHDLAAGGRDPEALRERLRASVPLGRNARAEEIAAMAAYLASDEAGFVTGAEFVIDGGVTAQ
ncbi:glucose 1-dehydrogenase [Methylobacterium isbiliense]|uniref:3-alpha-(Or 20-beta)-hydroxysteroid dehydrogenase n=1 Tax=Methylobacterium isbiliense TaxID=315478 RepID=A0ABQ4S8K4_9HYPH|nr:glucose 1-dehydrogenase [Methylobacterium isbiliense]MDN3622499.1 glucose 1-dehydrogenase [Methylobacterium isbiliense]GJD99301.1 3-alpha-(or 20-beta)-hydroxysteroid dehydrogenase [Methylobacterium isbiliense]